MEHQHTVWGWINHHWMLISLMYFPAFMGYLNSFVVFLKVMGCTKLADFLGRFEDATKAAVDSYKSQKSLQNVGKPAAIVLFFIGLSFMTGCSFFSSANGFCGRITGEGMTVPYIGGKANLDGFNCHVGCIGKCPSDIYAALAAQMKSYADSQTTNGKIMTMGPGTVTFIPSK